MTIYFVQKKVRAIYGEAAPDKNLERMVIESSKKKWECDDKIIGWVKTKFCDE